MLDLDVFVTVEMWNLYGLYRLMLSISTPRLNKENIPAFSPRKNFALFFCLSHTNLAGQANGMLFSSNELFKDAAHFKQRIVRKIYLAIEESGCWNGCMC